MVSSSDHACAVPLWQSDLCSPAFSTQRDVCKGWRSVSICSVVSTCSVLQLQTPDSLYSLCKKLLGSSDELPWVVITRLWLKFSTKQLFLWKECIVSLTCKPTAIKIGFWNYNNKKLSACNLAVEHAISHVLCLSPFPAASQCEGLNWSFSTFSLPLSALGHAASTYLCIFIWRGIDCVLIAHERDDNKMLITFSARALISICWNLPLMIPGLQHHRRQKTMDMLLAWESRDFPLCSQAVQCFSIPAAACSSTDVELLSTYANTNIHYTDNPYMRANVGFLLDKAVVSFFFFFCRPEIFSLLKLPWNGPLVSLRGILGSQRPVKHGAVQTCICHP